ASAQLGTSHLRRLCNQPIRAAAPRRVRAAAGVGGAAAAGRDGESAGRPVARSGAGLGSNLRISGGETAPLREARASAGPQDGAYRGAGGNRGGGGENRAICPGCRNKSEIKLQRHLDLS